jgi:hypothetical protein
VSIYDKNFLGKPLDPHSKGKGGRRRGREKKEGSIPQMKFYNCNNGRYHGPGNTSVHCAIAVIATRVKSCVTVTDHIS